MRITLEPTDGEEFERRVFTSVRLVGVIGVQVNELGATNIFQHIHGDCGGVADLVAMFRNNLNRRAAVGRAN